MKIINTLILMAVLFLPAYAYAFALPSEPCPCSTQNINEFTGAEILAEICPGGQLAPDAMLESNSEILSVSLGEPETPERREFGAGFIGPMGSPGCQLGVGFAGLAAGISPEELEGCRVTIMQACGLNVRPIPTLSEWGLIAMAGLLGLMGLFVLRRKKSGRLKLTNSRK